MTPQEDWVRCRPWIEAALEVTGFYTFEHVEHEIEAGRMHFWPGENSAAITEFLEFPTGKVLNVFAGGGDLEELTTKFEPCFMTWAKVAGCKQIIGYGRPGWERVCKRMGYRHLWTVMAKDVE